MLSICICDDEPILCSSLRNLLEEYRPYQELNIIEYHSISELLENTLNYDVLFLDIRFEEQDVGIDAAKILRKKGNKAIIVFLTSLPQYAPNGYEAEAFRYLIKPIERAALTTTMNDVLKRIESKNFRFSVISDSGTVIIEAADVNYIESVARRRVIHMRNQKVETWETMASLYDKLPADKFVYLQKGFVSNLSSIKQLKNNIVTLNGGEEIPLSRIYKKDFLLAFNQ